MNNIDWPEIGAALWAMLLCGLLVVAVIGWVLNIVALAHMDYNAIGMLIVRVVGIFIAPMGAVLGYVS